MAPPLGVSTWTTCCSCWWLVLMGWLTGWSDAKGSTGTAGYGYSYFGTSSYTTTYYGGGSGLPSAPFSPNSNTIDDGDDNGYIIPLIMGVFGGGFLLASLCIVVGMMHSSSKEEHDFQAGYPPSSLYVYGDQGSQGYSGEDGLDTDHDTEGPFYQDGVTSHHVQPA